MGVRIKYATRKIENALFPMPDYFGGDEYDLDMSMAEEEQEQEAAAEAVPAAAAGGTAAMDTR